MEKLVADFKNNISDGTQLTPEAHKIYQPLINNSSSLEEYIKKAFIERQAGDIHNQFLANNHIENHTDQKAKIVNKYINSHWTILTAIENDNFILGDNPGIMKNRKGYLPLTGPFEFIFPISSKRYLHMEHSGYDLDLESITKISYLGATRDNVKKINVQAACDCVDYVFGESRVVLEETKEEFLKFMATLPSE